jgi:group I intron endonuclease
MNNIKPIIGIYKINNIINNKCYIGQSWNVERRIKEHKYKAFNENSHDHNSYFSRSIRVHGIENFDIEIMKSFKSNVSQKTLDKWECKYIEYYDSMNRKKGYNAKNGGSKGKLNEATKLKMSDSQLGHSISDATKLKMRLTKLGGVHTKIHNIKIGKSGLGKKRSTETCIKMSNVRKGRFTGADSSQAKPIVCLDNKKIYNAVIEASQELGLDSSSVTKVCKGKYNSSKGFHFKYLDEYNPNETYLLKTGRVPKQVKCLETGIIYESTKKASIITKQSFDSIKKCAVDKTRTLFGFHWEYIDTIRSESNES